MVYPGFPHTMCDWCSIDAVCLTNIWLQVKTLRDLRRCVDIDSEVSVVRDIRNQVSNREGGNIILARSVLLLLPASSCYLLLH